VPGDRCRHRLPRPHRCSSSRCRRPSAAPWPSRRSRRAAPTHLARSRFGPGHCGLERARERGIARVSPGATLQQIAAVPATRGRSTGTGMSHHLRRTAVFPKAGRRRFTRTESPENRHHGPSHPRLRDTRHPAHQTIARAPRAEASQGMVPADRYRPRRPGRRRLRRSTPGPLGLLDLPLRRPRDDPAHGGLDGVVLRLRRHPRRHARRPRPRSTQPLSRRASTPSIPTCAGRRRTP
jgi:hypothetical protein